MTPRVGIVAQRRNDPRRVDIPGSILRTCQICKVECMVAPSSFPATAGTTQEIVCLECAIDQAEKTGKPLVFLPLTDMQTKEIAASKRQDT